MKPSTLLEWFPVVLRYGGAIGAFIFVPVFWAMTDRLEPALIGMFTLAWGFGEGVDAVREFKRDAPAPPEALPATRTEDGA